MSSEQRNTIPERSAIPETDQWDLSSLFSDQKGWDDAYAKLEAGLSTLQSFKGSLGTGPEQLKRYLDTITELELLDERLGYWAHLRTCEDAGNSGHQERFSRYMIFVLLSFWVRKKLELRRDIAKLKTGVKR